MRWRIITPSSGELLKDLRPVLAAVAQLDRALVYGTKGWGFDSLQPQYKVKREKAKGENKLPISDSATRMADKSRPRRALFTCQPVFGENGKIGEIYGIIAIHVCRRRAGRTKPLCGHYIEVIRIKATIFQQVCRIAEVE